MTLLSTPPVATADARSRPCFWRNRTCIAASAATGTARFENDIDDWSRTDGHRPTRFGTVPRKATANAASVAIPSTNASATNSQLASRIELQKTSGSPMRLSRNPTASSAATAITIDRGCTR